MRQHDQGASIIQLPGFLKKGPRVLSLVPINQMSIAEALINLSNPWHRQMCLFILNTSSDSHFLNTSTISVNM